MHKKRTEKGAYRMRNLFTHTIRPFFDVSFSSKICRKVSFVLGKILSEIILKKLEVYVKYV